MKITIEACQTKAIAFEKRTKTIVNTPTYRILLYFNCLKVFFKPIEGL